MIRQFLIGTLVAFGFSASALAQCNCDGNQQLKGNSLTSFVSGKTVCEPNGSGGWKGQEQHVSGGALVDYKMGPGHAKDPTEQVGTWAVAGTGPATTITYNYTSGGSYTFKACSASATTIGYCPVAGGNSTVNATVKTTPNC